MLRLPAMALVLATCLGASVPPLMAETAPAPAAAIKVAPNLETFTLANGLQVVVIPDRRAPIITHMIWYRVGRADEMAGKSGIAHFLEHLMFKGTQQNPAGKFSKRLATLGGQENAFTSQDYTSYFQKTPKEHLPLLMAYEADRMTGLILSEEDVRTERDVVLEERRQRTDNDPAAQLDEAMEAVLYRNHPYGTPVIGWEHEIRQLNRKDAFDFYARHYTPNNAVVVIAGDITPAEVRAMAEASYGKVARRFEVSPRQRPQEPPALAPRRVSMADARVRQPSLTRHYLAPSYTVVKDGSPEALDILSEVLGGQTGRIYKALVRDKGLATNASFGFSGTGVDYGRLSVSVVPKPGVSFADVEKALDDTIKEVLDKGITQEELDRARAALLSEYVYAQDSQGTLARLFGFGMLTGLTIEDIQGWPARIGKVTPADVQAAARTYLDIRRSVTGTLTKPAEKRS